MQSQIYAKREGARTNYYLVGRHVCDHCGQPLQYRGFCFATWKDARSLDIVLLCHNCLGQKPPVLPRWRQHYFSVLITEVIPRGAAPYFFKPPEYAPGALSSFDAASPTAKTVSDSTGARVIDRTKLSGRASATIDPSAQIGAPDMDLIEEQDRALDEDEGLAFLDELQKAEPVLSAEERKLLEVKE